jgi:hypothetical protein
MSQPQIWAKPSLTKSLIPHIALGLRKRMNPLSRSRVAMEGEVSDNSRRKAEQGANPRHLLVG